MSYEISNSNNDPITPGKYSKIDNEDCALLLQETSLDDDNDVVSPPKESEGRESQQSPNPREVLEQFDPIQPERIEIKPKEIRQAAESSDKQSLPETVVKQQQKPATPQPASSSKGDTKKAATTRKSPSHHRTFDISLSSLIRFLSFRRKKTSSKSADTGSVTNSQDNSTDSPSRKRKDDKGSQSSRTEKGDNEKPSVFHRFVRTFSFLYKRNPHPPSNFTRSKSMPGRPTTRSLPNIKVGSQPRSQVNSPTATKQGTRGGSVKHPKVSPEHQVVKPRAGSDIPVLNRAKENHVNAGEPKVAEPPVVRSTSPRDEPDTSKNIQKELAREAVTQVVNVNRGKHLVIDGVETPAVCGIQNHGNTCFINSTIQCLSNTDLLAEYFVFNHYREDLLRPKVVNKKYGTRGELTEHFAILLKSLWSCMYSSDISQKFKKTVSKFGDQYNGCDQHDAQEFLLWLLDKCHEDLTVQSPKTVNKNSFMPFKKGFTKRPPRKASNDQIVTDEVAAIESLAKYQTVNSNSIIYDLFQGQLRSMVVCRNCEHYSKTFDPYLCLSLPVPIRHTLTIFIHAIFLEQDRNSGMYGISIEAAATLRELRDKISRMLKIQEKKMILLQIDKKHGMIEFSNDTNMIQEIFEDFETIYALETPTVPETENNQLIDTGETPPQELTSMCQQMLTIVWLNRVGIDKEGTIFGPLFTALVSRECTYRKLQSKILATMSDYLIDSENVDCDDISRSINLRLRVVNGLPGKEYLSTDVDHPLFVPTVESALSKTEDKRIYRGPYHLKIMVEWDLDVRHSILVNDDLIDAIYDKNGVFIDKSVELAKERSNMNNRTSLQDCLDIYFREESLTADNAWMCPSCNSRQQCVKQLSVWTLPNIFIMHLKRFRYISNVRRIKINTMIEYPQNGLDMLKYVAQRKFNSTSDSINNVNSQVANGINNCSKFSNKRKLQNIVEETTFNLYGVVCHKGTMQGGHYTAYCKNPVDNCWYLFDDTKVSPVLEEAVVTADAYLLFYQKSSLSTVNTEPKANPSTSSISSGYLSSVTCSSYNHWSSQMPPFNYFNNGNDKSSTLPNRKAIPPNKANAVANSLNSKQVNGNPRAATGAAVATPNHEATKHSNTNYIHQNGGKKPEPAAVAANKNYSSSNNHYNNTFPRVKVRQASH